MSHESPDYSGWRSIPGFAKIVMAIQSAVIFFLSFWIFQEYLSNPYLQTYVNSFLQGSGSAVVALSFVAFFSIATVLLFRKLRTARKELETLSTEPSRHPSEHGRGFLDHQTEQHLIEMIKKTSTAEPVSQAAAMPVLKTAGSEEPTSNQPKSE